MKFPEASWNRIKKARGHLAEILDANLHTMKRDELFVRRHLTEEYAKAVI